MVGLVSVSRERIAEAATTLAHAMLNEPGGRWLFPDPVEFVDLHEAIFMKTMTHALDEGFLGAWGDPIVGVAVWVERPSIGWESRESQRSPAPPLALPEHAAARVEEFDKLLRLMRKRARPDHHLYLDSIGVLQDHRRRGVASSLLESGLVRSDARGLPCSLDTLDSNNLGFYRRRGFEIVASELLADSGLTFTSMRRVPGAVG